MSFHHSGCTRTIVNSVHDHTPGVRVTRDYGEMCLWLSKIPVGSGWFVAQEMCEKSQGVLVSHCAYNQLLTVCGHFTQW